MPAAAMYWQLTMKSIIQTIGVIALSLAALPCPGQATPQEQALKLHNIFGSDMVRQRGKPIKIWGWGRPGDPVSVDFGGDTGTAVVAAAAPVNVFGEAETYAGKGRWEVTLPEREANAEPQALTVTAGDESVVLENILVGDVWVMYGAKGEATPPSVSNSAKSAMPGPQSKSLNASRNSRPLPQRRRNELSASRSQRSTPDLQCSMFDVGRSTFDVRGIGPTRMRLERPGRSTDHKEIPCRP